MKKVPMLCSALLSMAAVCCAQNINWTKDPVAQLNALNKETALKVPAASAVAVNLGGKQSSQSVLAAEPLNGAGEISDEYLDLGDTSANLILNNTKDRVGAEFVACGDDSQDATDNVPDCDYVRFNFPQLSYDKKAEQVMLGGEVVAKDHWFGGLKLEPSFKLVYKVSAKTVDLGFDRGVCHFVSLALVRTGR